jgi:hypothetical protein
VSETEAIAPATEKRINREHKPKINNPTTVAKAILKNSFIFTLI